MIDVQGFEKNSTEKSCVPFTKFPPMVTSYLFIVQYKNQQIGFDTVRVQFYSNLLHT